MTYRQRDVVEKSFYLTESGLTFSSVLKELRKLKYIHTLDCKKLLSPTTKKQQDILSACGLSTDDLPTWHLGAKCTTDHFNKHQTNIK